MASENIAASKRCSKCGFVKAAEHFHLASNKKSGLRSDCKACNADMRAKRASKDAATKAIWRKDNAEKIRTKNAEWYAAHRVDRLKQIEEWKSKNKARVDEKRRQRYDPKKQCLIQKRHREKYPEKALIYNQKRRASKRAASGAHTVEEIEALLVEQDHCCANPYCRADLRCTPMDLDHVVALSCGGSDGIENLQWLCQSCNRSKKHYSMGDWLDKQKRKKRR